MDQYRATDDPHLAQSASMDAPGVPTPPAPPRHGRALLRVLLPSLLTLCLAASAIFLVALPTIETKMMSMKHQKLQDIVNTAWGLLEDLDRQVHDKALTLPEAQAEAVRILRNMRYGPEHKDYFWINDMTPRVVMHPYRPELEGTEVGGVLDSDGVDLFQAFVETVRGGGSGFVAYKWQWKDDATLIESKLSYVRLFEPWGWIVGTGVYIEDVREEMAALARRMMGAFVGILALIATLSTWLITQSTRAERRFHESHERFRTVLDGLDALVYVADMETYEILFVNKTGRNNWGNIVGRTCWDTIQAGMPGPCPGCANPHLLDEQGEPTGIMTRESRSRLTKCWYEHRDQAVRWIDGRLVRLSVNTDITARKEAEFERARLEEQLLHAQKMEAVGNLAGGVAHDFNNLLAGIMGHAQLIEMEAEADGDIDASAKSIVKASKRAADLTQQLLAFSRKGKLRVEPLDLHELIRDVIRLLEHSVDPRIEISDDLQAQPSYMQGDPTQIQNALLNLGVNARDAMPEGGILSFTTRDLVLGPEEVRQHYPGIAPGNYIQLEVADTGVGMTDEVRRSAFEPFFTTKGPAGGTGLGLAGVYGCVKGHQGLVDLSSTPGLGTRFTILLPRTEVFEPEAVEPKIRPQPGQGIVLLVDDEAAVRGFAAQALGTLGYDVVACEDGREAVDWIHDNAQTADLVLLDLIMPRMTGEETFHALRKIRPDIPILLASGFAKEDVGTRLLKTGNCEFMTKPFTIQELSARIARLIPSFSQHRN